MKFNSLIPELSVSDIKKTTSFYVDILGFKVEYERPEKKFVFLSYEGNQLMFEQENGNWSVGQLEYPYGRGINFEMTVTDLQKLYDRVISAGIEPFREIMENRYRNGDDLIVQREFLIQDPDGYLLRFTG